MNNTNAREVAKVVAKTIYMDPIQDIAKMVRERIDMEIDAKQRQRCADADNSIFNDEEAMDLIRLLREKGYEADEVYNAMKDMGS